MSSLGAGGNSWIREERSSACVDSASVHAASNKRGLQREGFRFYTLARYPPGNALAPERHLCPGKPFPFSKYSVTKTIAEYTASANSLSHAISKTGTPVTLTLIRSLPAMVSIGVYTCADRERLLARPARAGHMVLDHTLDELLALSS